MIIDAHTHLYPPHVYVDPASWASARGEAYWLACVKPATGPALQSWASRDQMIQEMDTAEVDKAILLGWYWENHDTCAENLKWLLESSQAHPNRLIAFAPFNARGGQAALDLLRQAFDLGCKGMGELNPPAQGYSYQDPVLHEALELAARAGAPVNFHVTDPASRPYPGKIDTPFAALLELAHRHPRTNFIFSHLGGLMTLHGRPAAPDNVWFDSAAVPLLYPSSIYRAFCDAMGSERLLFGTDYPLRVYPRKEKTASLRNRLDGMLEAELTADERHRIMGENARRLLQLS